MADEKKLAKLLLELDQLHIDILFYKLIEESDEDIGDKYYSKSGGWIRARMGETYDSLEYPTEMHSSKKNKELADVILPLVDRMTAGDPSRVKDWPKNAILFDDLDQTEEGVEENDEDLDPVRPNLENEAEKLDQIRSRNLLAFAAIGSLLLLMALIGVFAYEAGQRQALPASPTPATIPPATEVVTEATQQPVIPSLTPSSLATSVPTLTPTITPLPLTDTPVSPTPDFIPVDVWAPINSDVYIRMENNFENPLSGRCFTNEGGFAVVFEVKSSTHTAFLLRFDPNDFHAEDDIGTQFPLIGAGYNRCDNFGPQVIQGWDMIVIAKFGGQMSQDSHSLIVTAESINGKRFVFHKDL